MASDPVLLQGREGRWQWRWAVGGTLLTIALIGVLSRPADLLASLAESHDWMDRGLLDLTLDPEQPFTFANVAISSVPLLLCPLIVLQFVHRVPWRRAFAYRGDFDWPLFLRTALAMLLVSALASLVAALSAPDEFELESRGLDHVPWALLGLGVVFLAALGEEVLFKGYLLRVWGAVFPARWPLVLILVVLFTYLHAGNADLGGDRAFGLFYFAMTEVVWFSVYLRTQNLAASAGLHFMNNAWDTLFVARAPDQATSLALIVQTDPLGAGGPTRLLDLHAHAFEVMQLALVVALLYWRPSPFYLPAATAHPPDLDDDGARPYTWG
jgi:membrane protease YdiL (CAAX protease family)